MLESIGWPELLVILAVATLLFGGKKIPEVAKGWARAYAILRPRLKAALRKTSKRPDRLEDPIQKVRRPLLQAQAI